MCSQKLIMGNHKSEQQRTKACEIDMPLPAWSTATHISSLSTWYMLAAITRGAASAIIIGCW